MSKFTPGPWQVWPGPAYVGGGEDLCIGAGSKWLANMDHRNCKSRDAHFAEMVDHDKAGLEDDTDICSFSDEITEEQAANARLIAKSPAMYDLLREIVAADDDQPTPPDLKAAAIFLMADIEPGWRS